MSLQMLMGVELLLGLGISVKGVRRISVHVSACDECLWFRFRFRFRVKVKSVESLRRISLHASACDELREGLGFRFRV